MIGMEYVRASSSPEACSTSATAETWKMPSRRGTSVMRCTKPRPTSGRWMGPSSCPARISKPSPLEQHPDPVHGRNGGHHDIHVHRLTGHRSLGEPEPECDEAPAPSCRNRGHHVLVGSGCRGPGGPCRRSPAGGRLAGRGPVSGPLATTRKREHGRKRRPRDWPDIWKAHPHNAITPTPRPAEEARRSPRAAPRDP